MEKLYRPSGKVPGTSVLIVLAAAAAGGALAPLYAAASLYVPLIYVNIVPLVALYGWLTGKAAGLAARATVTLNPRAAGLLALPGALAGFALSWAAWMGLLHMFGHGHVRFPGAGAILGYLSSPGGWASLLAEPGAFLDSVREVYETGLWTIGSRSSCGSELKGFHLLAVWTAELAIYLAFAAGAAANAARTPYSPEAGAFLRAERQLPLGVATPEEPGQTLQVYGAMSIGNLEHLFSAPKTAPGDLGFYVTLHSHRGSPWGTADVVCKVMVGKKKEIRPIVNGAILAAPEMELIRARLSQ
ncbi:MAG: hypothetical protein LBQ79_00315 [Deltaproteobacteria bacterium]|jgi:hypothetical protein|nr:hypothetical protein [Deltaproteobacteria bacterium]